jgi:hypothetical protein
MVTAWIRLRPMAAMVALLAVASLALVGCKQGLGDRCEQNTDCSSGICGDGADMASAAGKQCVAVVGGVATGTAGSSGGAAGSGGAGGGTVYGDAAADTSEVHAEVGAETGGQETSSSDASDASDVASDATEAGGN